MEQQAKRTRRTPQQIADDIDVKIQELNKAIEGIEEKKAAAIADFNAKIEAKQQMISALEEKKKAVLALQSPENPGSRRSRK